MTTRSVCAGSPRVIVPVLSSTMVFSLCAVSRASAERIRIPCSAPLPVLTITESGVARPSAQGQAMMSTATAATIAEVNAGWGPNTNQATNVRLRAVTDDTRGARLEADQHSNRLAGAGFRSGLKQTAQKDQRDDHAGSLEVHVAESGRQDSRSHCHDEAVAKCG